MEKLTKEEQRRVDEVGEAIPKLMSRAMIDEKLNQIEKLIQVLREHL